MNARRRTVRRRHPRGGYVALLFIGTLLVVLGVMALVVDRMWVDNASVEIQAGADTAALAAARTLVSDDTLREDFDWQPIIDRALENAQRASALNPVAGGDLRLRPGPDGDVWFGQNVVDKETGQSKFVFTDWQPTVVKVRAERTEDTSNPVHMLVGGIFGVPHANVSTFSTVEIDNHVLGIRPGEKLPVPALPFAILAKDDAPAEGEGDDSEGDAATEAAPKKQSWATAIDAREGRDDLSWDGERNELVRKPDGLPEIVVRPMRRGEKAGDANVQLLDFRSDFRFDVLGEQIEFGLTTKHLQDLGGEMLLDGRHHEMRCTATVDDRVFDMLEQAVGQPRLCFLYEYHEAAGRYGEGTLDVTRLVAVRVMEIRRSPSGNGTEAVLQPTVVATKTAIPFEDWQWEAAENAHTNPYVYTLTVTDRK